MSKESYLWYKEHGICVNCRSKDAVGKMTMCEDCLYKRQQKYHRLSADEKQKSKEAWRARRKRLVEARRCTKCGKPVCEKSKYLCENCRVKQMLYFREFRAKKDKRTFEQKQEAERQRKVKAYEGYLKYLQSDKGKIHMQNFSKAGRQAFKKIFALKKTASC